MNDIVFREMHRFPQSAPATYEQTYHAFAHLVRSFHVLMDCPEDILIPRFNPQRFDDWVVSIAHGEFAVLQAGAFILGTFNSDSYKCGPFQLWQAMGAWDAANRRAFVCWAADAWRP